MISIRNETARPLAAPQECAVLRAAATRSPELQAPIRRRLAVLLKQLDAFDEAIALLERPLSSGAPDDTILLAETYLARRGPNDLSIAYAIALDAAQGSSSTGQKAAALAVAGRALLLLGKTESARAVLSDALAADPHNIAACERLVTDLLTTGEEEAALVLLDRLSDVGVRHAQALALRAVLLARMGLARAARDLLGLDAFVATGRMEPPDGWTDLRDFDEALARELMASPALRHGRHGTASVESLRIDSLSAGVGPLATMLREMILNQVRAYCASLPQSGHAWIEARPRAAMLRSWCVITERDGYERWHMHPAGWMSGVYYVQVPDAVALGSGEGGCLTLGLADSLAGAAAAAEVGNVLIRPEPGRFALFPSHNYHRTFPHRTEGRRICVAFDLDPEGQG